MITDIFIQNFQVHKKFRAKLDMITTFTGPTDAGKSTIIDAMKWLVEDKPLGDKFMNEPDIPTIVGIKTDKGKVYRKKGKGVNYYKLNKGKPLEAFNKKVPEKVQQFLKMSGLNFQYQFDAPYLFFISHGKVATELNKIFNLDIIDTTLSKLNKQVQTGQTTVKVTKKRLDEIENKLHTLNFVKPMIKQYDRLEKLRNNINEGSSYLSSLHISISDVGKYTSQAEMLLNKRLEAEKVFKIGLKYKKVTNKIETLSDLIKTYTYNQSIIDSDIPDISQLVLITDKWKKVKAIHKALYRCITEIKTEKVNICQNKKLLLIRKKELKKMIGKTCPLYGSKIKTK